MKNALLSSPAFVESVANRNVVLVDAQDKKLGLMNVLEAHRGVGVRHRAISVLLYNSRGEVLLQKRSEAKPLWPHFWSNTVCTHPFDSESYGATAVRRLKEEMGIILLEADLREVYRFEYQARYDSELSEWEVDTVYTGLYEGSFAPNELEVEDHKWAAWSELVGVDLDPEVYTPWFGLMVKDGRLGETLSKM